MKYSFPFCKNVFNDPVVSGMLNKLHESSVYCKNSIRKFQQTRPPISVQVYTFSQYFSKQPPEQLPISLKNIVPHVEKQAFPESPWPRQKNIFLGRTHHWERRAPARHITRPSAVLERGFPGYGRNNVNCWECKGASVIRPERGDCQAGFYAKAEIAVLLSVLTPSQPQTC